MSSDTFMTFLSAGIQLVVSAIAFLIWVAVSYFLYSLYNRIPQQFRKQEPMMVWLLLVPCVNIIWMFFVFPGLSNSLKAYFDSIGRTDVGDCGASLGLWYAITTLICCFPVNLILLVMYLLKVKELTSQIKTA